MRFCQLTICSKYLVHRSLVLALIVANGCAAVHTISEEALEQKLFPPSSSGEPPAKALPDFEYIYRELKAHRKFNLTLDLLWQEYKEQHPEGYQYSQFCGLYRRYRGKLGKRFHDIAQSLDTKDTKKILNRPLLTWLRSSCLPPLCPWCPLWLNLRRWRQRDSKGRALA